MNSISQVDDALAREGSSVLAFDTTKKDNSDSQLPILSEGDCGT